MNITIAIYSFHYNEVFVKVPFEIARETDKCYYVNNGNSYTRYLKSEINKPILRSVTSYPYIELVMVDANEETLRDELSKWFTNKAYDVWKI